MFHQLTMKWLLCTVLCSAWMTTRTLAVSGDDLASAGSWLGPEFGVLQKVYDDCQNKNDFTGCLKGKALVALTKAATQDSISIVDGVYLERQNDTAAFEATPSLTSARAMSDLTGIDRQLMQKLDHFLRSHVVKMDMSEGREKDKKEHKRVSEYAIAAFMTAIGIAAPLGLKALAVIAGKALVISKVALTIAGIIVLKKLFKHEHHEKSSIEIKEHNRRNAYLNGGGAGAPPTRSMLMSASPASGGTSGSGAGAGSSAGLDPYQYYYNYPASQQTK